MAHYIIKTPYQTVIRKQRGAAADSFLIATYDALAAGGQLDTRAGHSFMDAARTMANDVASGAYSLFDFSRPLPHGSGLVQFERTA